MSQVAKRLLGRAFLLELVVVVVCMGARPSGARAQAPSRPAGGAVAGSPEVASAAAAAPSQGRVLTLAQAVATALEQNETLEGVRWTLEGAQAQVREAWGTMLPQVSFSASYTRNLDVPQFFLPAIFFDSTAAPGDVIPVQGGSDNSWYAQARADQTLFNPAVLLGVGAAHRYTALQREVVRGQAQQVATDARLSYYGVLLAREQHRLMSNSVERVAQVLEETRKLNRAGLASEYDVLRLEVELSNLQPNLTRSANAAEAARRALAVTMGEASLDGVELAGSLLTQELPAPPTAELVANAPADRSDLRQLTLTRDLRETERKVEIAQYLPRITLFGTWTTQGQGNGNPTWFGENRFSAKAVGVEVSVPLFGGFQRPARVGRLSAQVNQAASQLAYAADQAANEVRTLLDQARESYDRAVAQRRAVDQAQRGYEIARKEYRAGMGSQLQVTDAELALRQSEFNYAQAVYDYLSAQARLDVAIGHVPLVDDEDGVALRG